MIVGTSFRFIQRAAFKDSLPLSGLMLPWFKPRLAVWSCGGMYSYFKSARLGVLRHVFF